MTIYLVRHGETVGNRDRVMQLPDIPLSEHGLRQAEQLAERLAGEGIVHILASDLPRARMTAEPLAARLGLAIETTPLLHERNFGALRGTPYADLKTDPFALDFEPPEGESWEVFHARVARAFALICQRRQEVGGNLAVVTHGLVCRAILGRHVPGVDPTIIEHMENTSVSLLDAVAPYTARLINCCAHLGRVDARGGLV
ncbi:MAG: histidine phosphatase family protein [Polyangiales bacterium]